MDRIQHSSATPDHQFTEGDPGNGVPATTVTAAHMNGVQNELVHIIEQAGLTPDEANHTQVLQALGELFPAKAAEAALVASLAAEVARAEAAESSEAAARSSADTALVASLDSEVTRAKSAESSEATARSSADSALSSLITHEATLRQDAFASLQTNLNAINENLSSIVTAHANEIESVNTRVAALESMNSAFVAINISESSGVGSSGALVGQFTVPAGQQWALSASVRVEASPTDSDSVVKVRSIYINVNAAGTGTIGIGTIPDLYAPAETGGADTVHGGGSITALIPSASTPRAVAVYVVPTTSNGAAFSIKGGRIIAWRLD